MISIETAEQQILKTARDFGEESVPLKAAVGRVLRETLRSDRDLPPYFRVSMDGIAIAHAAFAQGRRRFPIEGMAAAGSARKRLQDSLACWEVMTGGILPEGCDTVIRYEDLQIEDGIARVNLEELKPGKNVHPRAADRRAGDPLVPPGKVISGAELGVAATIGKTRLRVSRLPKSVIISTGDELVPVEAEPLEHQIRRSNVYSIFAALQKFGIEADLLHLADDLASVKKSMATVIGQYDMVILSGGVSKGKFDFLPEALDDLGVKKVFHRIKLRPGKPFWFGTAPAGAIIFALPGNPVSSFMCTQRFIVPWIKESLQLEKRARPHAILGEDFSFKPDLTYFLQVRVQANPKGELLAIPVVGNGSGDLANLGDADAFLELPRGREHFRRGEAFPLIPYRELT